MDITKLMRQDLSEFAPHFESPTMSQIAEDVSVDRTAIVKANVGENSAVESVLDKSMLIDIDLFRYPDPLSIDLRARLSDYTGLPMEAIFCANGADDVLDVLSRLFLTPGDEALICPPTFALYKMYARLSGAKVVGVNRKADFSLNLESIRAAITDRTKIIYIDSPGNPSGVTTGEGIIRELLSENIVVIVDEAYFEYCGDTVAPLILEYPNLVVVRTFSKWAGMAGLRVGYALAHPDIIRGLGRIKMPYNVNVAAQSMACQVLEKHSLVIGQLESIKQIRDRAIDELSTISGISILPSKTAYIVIYCLGRSARQAQKYLYQQGIVVRVEDQPLIRNALRVNLASERELATFKYHFIRWLDSFIAPQPERSAGRSLVVRTSPGTASGINDVLDTVGRPLNKAARSQTIKMGQPVYLVSDLPFMRLFPAMNQFLESGPNFEETWKRLNAGIADFYARSSALQDIPVWYVDELKLNQQREAVLESYLADHPAAMACYLDRVVDTSDRIDTRFQASRSLVVQDDMIERDDWPRALANRPGAPTIERQLDDIKTAYDSNGAQELVIVDSGFASGNTVLDVSRWLGDKGVRVRKMIGSVGWYPRSYQSLRDYDPDCVIWFDILKSGWVDTRDYYIFNNTGTPVAEREDRTGLHRLASRRLQNGASIGFNIPYVASGSRWFRIDSPHDTRKLLRICLQNTFTLINELCPQATIEDLAQMHEDNHSMFLLPVPFGDVNKPLQTIRSSTLLSDYIDEHFGYLQTSNN